MDYAMKKNILFFVCFFLIALFIFESPGMSALSANAMSAKRINVLIAFRSIPQSSDQTLVEKYGGVVKFRYHLVPAIAASLPKG